ncbi:MAG TPA: D-2-hydroxyacid dehydrogenase family protein [Candidatus Binatia bacterium]|nr:D-2-hydroxyacid dehydrogenase family protein [Candidatus Binatia bacterium]
MSDQRLRVAILDDFEKIADTVPAYAKLKACTDVTILRERLENSEQIVQTLRGFDALLLMRERTRFSDKEYSQLPRLKLISQTGRTSRHLDLPAATRRGIAVAGTPSDSGSTTKELTIGLILALLRKIPQVNQRMREERWPALTGLMLEGKTIGVLGFGRIGREVARIMKAFDTRVLAYSRTLTPEKAAESGAEAVSMETLLRESDVVTLHIQFNEQTRGIIGAKELALMKAGAYLVNTGRGPLVVEQAMIQALESGRLGGVGLDVYDIEPLPMDHPLRRFDNAILMSHRGYATVEILSERYEQAMENILSFIDRKPVDLLNSEIRDSNKP